MPELVRVTILLDQDTVDRLTHQADRRSRDVRVVMAEVLHDVAQAYPVPPKPQRLSNTEVRALRKEALGGGPTAYTQAVDVIPPGRRPQ